MLILLKSRYLNNHALTNSQSILLKFSPKDLFGHVNLFFVRFLVVDKIDIEDEEKYLKEEKMNMKITKIINTFLPL